MDRKTKIFFLVFFLLILCTLGITYYTFVIAREYTIQSEEECDPESETCFLYQCDPVVETCSGNPEEDITYYKIVSRLARNIPECSLEDADCEAFACLPDEEGCVVTYCDDEDEEAICSQPEDYEAEEESEERESTPVDLFPVEE